MLKKVTTALMVICFSSVLAHADGLKSSMKQMKKAFRDAAESSNVEEMKGAMTRLDQIVGSLDQGEYDGDQAAVYKEGIQKLSVAIAQVESQLDQGNLQGAKDELKKVDGLRSEYHHKVKD
ncbi:cytochrome b562 [Vibrio mangrovi]|uniref:Cytochrome b562 n=1 Tax=Vibrio mangrovi TaxID=474394 RepID=A0A1Y6J419_9VIBR|nr:cytochrome b562 [Vibrio mangrovi]MDW6005341.1 cytochrome b562 [Vibrio mangrovi]SMS03053.1 Cytochrome b562 [Vibrio mangrovi]